MVRESKSFFNLLVEKGGVQKEKLEEAIRIHKKEGGALREVLIKLGCIEEKNLTFLLSAYLSVPPIKLLNLSIPEEILKLIPWEYVQKYQVIPVSKIGDTVTVAVADPLDILVLDDLERITRSQINPVIASGGEIKEAIDRYYKKSLSDTVEEIIKDVEIGSFEVIKEERKEVKEEEITHFIEDAPIIKLTNYILRRAVEEKASDIFIEPLEEKSRVRFRIDGFLREAEVFPKKMHPFVVSRIKVMANLNIAEHRLPQDGRFRMNISGREVDFRVSILSSTLGEKATLRVLDCAIGLLDLDSLGFEEDVTRKLKEDSLSSHGMIIVCGPTGCGKTTTLYSILKYIYTPQKNIITVEDPIEYRLGGIIQVNVNYEIGLTFSSCLRSILRQDPDVIMVGEIRDRDTADIAIKSSLTGHLVLSTLHTTTSVGSITRLINMGIEPFLLSSTIIGALAQRLIRKLCPKCKEVNKLADPLKEKYKIKKEAVIYRAKGCPHCRNQGYQGRVGLSEYFHLDSEIKNLINSSCSEHVIRKEAEKRGLRSLREDGILKVEKGITSLEEVLRITASQR
ncbi:MAG: hypothetical protein B6D56_07835 [Candidatus Omnitrophica bacterium 4484_70.1]|nr:MAG: hypothetical protein B6D56_07835 [Candidatus Omnitrophica bacterium 4484_70.1]